jgi:TonB family protein
VAESASAESATAQQRKSAHSPLTLKNKDQHKSPAVPQTPAPDTNDTREIASAAVAPAPAAGSRYGSLTEGPSAGAEVRPALPVTTAEPMVGAGDLQAVAEGNVVVEITIDESGNIVSKIVVQSLGPNIDAKVLAALENWHFRPATSDGVPIPSKQDVVYHFKPR